MKFVLLLSLVVVSFLIGFGMSRNMPTASADEQKKPEDTYVLAKESKLGQVTFSHVNHITQNRSVDGTKPIECVECHHTAQPATEAVKHPPHKTAWPADRTTTLTADLLAKDPNAVGAICTECHARADTKPKLLPEIPVVKFEGSEEPTVMTNQQAFHRNCGGCHDEVVKARPAINPAPPTSKKCLVCHKKAAA